MNTKYRGIIANSRWQPERAVRGHDSEDSPSPLDVWDRTGGRPEFSVDRDFLLKACDGKEPGTPLLRAAEQINQFNLVPGTLWTAEGRKQALDESNPNRTTRGKLVTEFMGTGRESMRLRVMAYERAVKAKNLLRNPYLTSDLQIKDISVFTYAESHHLFCDFFFGDIIQNSKLSSYGKSCADILCGDSKTLAKSVRNAVKMADRRHVKAENQTETAADKVKKRRGKPRKTTFTNLDWGAYAYHTFLPSIFPQQTSCQMMDLVVDSFGSHNGILHVVLPCAGWGARFIGVAAWAYKHRESAKVRVSVCDVSYGVISAHREMDAFVNRAFRLPNLYTEFLQSKSQDDEFWDMASAIGDDATVRILMASPPYFHTELYASNSIWASPVAQGSTRHSSNKPFMSQSHEQYDSYDAWCSGFLSPTIDKAGRFLNGSAKALSFWNISSVPKKDESLADEKGNLVEQSFNAWVSSGLHLQAVMGLCTSCCPGEKGRDQDRNVEPVLVFGKGGERDFNDILAARRAQEVIPSEKIFRHIKSVTTKRKYDAFFAKQPKRSRCQSWGLSSNGPKNDSH